MRAKFVRGKDVKGKLGLGLVSLNLDLHNFDLDENAYDESGMIYPDYSSPDTRRFMEILKEAGVNWEITSGFEEFPVWMRITGNRDGVAKVLASYLDEDLEKVRNGLYNWDGKNESELWDNLEY